MQLRIAGVSSGRLPQLLPFSQHGGPGRDPRGGCEVLEPPDRAYAGNIIRDSSDPLYRGRGRLGCACQRDGKKRGDRKYQHGNAACDSADSRSVGHSNFVVQLEGEQTV